MATSSEMLDFEAVAPPVVPMLVFVAEKGEAGYRVYEECQADPSPALKTTQHSAH